MLPPPDWTVSLTAAALGASWSRLGPIDAGRVRGLERVAAAAPGAREHGGTRRPVGLDPPPEPLLAGCRASTSSPDQARTGEQQHDDERSGDPAD